MKSRLATGGAALAIALVLLILYATLPAASPTALAQSLAKALKAADLDALQELLPQGAMEASVLEAGDRKLEPVRKIFARAENAGFGRWSRRYTATLVSGIEAYRETLAEINKRAREQFSSLSDAQREQASTPEGRNKWMASIAASVLGAEHAKTAGPLENFVNGQPSMQYVLREGWLRVKQADNLSDADAALYTLEPSSQEFNSRIGQNGRQSILTALGVSEPDLVSRLQPSMTDGIAAQISRNLAPEKPELRSHCAQLGMTSLSRADKTIAEQYKFEQLSDQGFRSQQGRDYLKHLLKASFGEASFGVKDVEYRSLLNGRFLRGDSARVTLEIARKNGTEGRVIDAERTSWRWKLTISRLEELL